MNELNELLSIEPCDCGRSRCDFFGGGIGEHGESFSREELEWKLKELDEIDVEKVRAHLKRVLETTSH